MHGLGSELLMRSRGSFIARAMVFISRVAKHIVFFALFLLASCDYAIITSLLRLKDVATSFWCNNVVIIASCVRWVVSISFRFLLLLLIMKYDSPSSSDIILKYICFAESGFVVAKHNTGIVVSIVLSLHLPLEYYVYHDTYCSDPFTRSHKLQ